MFPCGGCRLELLWSFTIIHTFSLRVHFFFHSCSSICIQHNRNIFCVLRKIKEISGCIIWCMTIYLYYIFIPCWVCMSHLKWYDDDDDLGEFLRSVCLAILQIYCKYSFMLSQAIIFIELFLGMAEWRVIICVWMFVVTVSRMSDCHGALHLADRRFNMFWTCIWVVAQLTRHTRKIIKK